MKNIIRITLFTIFLLSIFGGIPNSSVRAATEWAVTNTNDSGAGSLRQAVANAFAGDKINFSPSLAGKTITLGSTIAITKNVTIDGAGLVPRIEISGGDSVRIFRVDTPTVTMKNLVLRNGKQIGLTYQSYGAAMFVENDTNLTIQNVHFANNSAYVAGAIYVSPYANLIISDSEFTNNITDSDASAIYVKSIGTLKLTNSHLSDNTAGDNGAIYFSGATSFSLLENNVFSNNTAESGGAIYAQFGNARIEMYNNLFTGNSSTSPSGGGGALYLWRTSTPTLLIIENNTFYSNTATYRGGAIIFSNSGDVYFNNNTMSDNDANQGGNAFLGGGSNFEKIYNNIMANSSSGGDCYLMGTVSMTGSNNLIEDGSATCSPNIMGDPELSAPADHGGPTETMSILNTSPAWDAGNDAYCTETDQRGVARPQGTHCDIGAFEFDNTPPTVSSIIRTDPDSTNALSVNFTVTFSEAVSGVDTGDFVLTNTVITDASITGVSGSGDTYTITVNTGSGDGTIRLDIPVIATITDLAANSLDGLPFISGQIYTIIKSIPPKAPVLSSPRTNTVANNTTPSFWWMKVKGGETYEIEFATDNAFTSNVDNEIVNATSYTVITPFGDGTYFWRVRAYNSSNRPGAWSSTRIFTIDTTGPLAPVLVSPGDNTSSNRTPIFKWLNVPAAVLYEFQYDDDLGFVDPTYTATVRGTFRRPPAMGVGTYYWRVRAKDSAGNWGDWSAPFTINISR